MYLTQGIHRAVIQKPDRCATIMGERRRSWREFKDRVARLAAGFASLGLRRGDLVTVISLNSDWYIEVYMAIWWAGGVIVPGNIRWALAEHIYAIQNCESRFLVVDAQFVKLVAPIAEKCEIAKAFLLGEGDCPEGLVSTETLIQETAPMADSCGHDDDLAALFYTGGTTGRSKGVKLSHRSLISNFLCINATYSMRDDGIFLHSAPMFHVADASIIVQVTMIGGTHVVVPFFSPENVASAIAREGVTDVLLVPTMFAMIAEHIASRPLDFGSVRAVTYGAAPITEALLNRAMKLFPNAEFKQSYGQTELSPAVTLLLPEFHKPSADGKSYLRSAGRAMVGVDIKIMDEDLQELPLHAVGEILVRSPGAMTGYWKLPDLTRQTMVDGWIRTGDAGYMDEEGFLYLVDRVKDMIVSGGENVYSAEVEQALSSHAAVAECAVFGVPDEKWGERVHAVIRLKIALTATPEELIAHCRTFIAGYKCPQSIELWTEPLPLSGVGKVQKNELRKRHWPESDQQPHRLASTHSV